MAYAAWPEVDESLLVEDSVELAVQILGMDCARVTVSAGSGKDAILTAARQAVADQLAGKKVVKEIVVPVRLVNFVAK